MLEFSSWCYLHCLRILWIFLLCKLWVPEAQLPKSDYRFNYILWEVSHPNIIDTRIFLHVRCLHDYAGKCKTETVNILLRLQVTPVTKIRFAPYTENTADAKESWKLNVRILCLKSSLKMDWIGNILVVLGSKHAFSALTLWLGIRNSIRPAKIEWWGVGVYLSGARCRLFAYGPADATASQNPIISCLI